MNYHLILARLVQVGTHTLSNCFLLLCHTAANIARKLERSKLFSVNRCV